MLGFRILTILQFKKVVYKKESVSYICYEQYFAHEQHFVL